MSISNEHCPGSKFGGKVLDTKQTKWQNTEENYSDTSANEDNSFRNHSLAET